MPMTAAGNQIALGDKLHFFQSPVPNERRCLIWGHGGLLHGDGTYALPTGVTVEYYVPHGQTRVTSPTQGIGGPAMGDALPPHGFTLTGPANIENYTLRKGVGSGLSGTTFSYHDVERQMVHNDQYRRTGASNWCPHVVSVRRRFQFIGKTIQLGEIIDAVRQHDPIIDQFVYGACRNDLSGKPWKSGAKRVAVEVFC